MSKTTFLCMVAGLAASFGVRSLNGNKWAGFWLGLAVLCALLALVREQP
jgi:hypothetical protein